MKPVGYDATGASPIEDNQWEKFANILAEGKLSQAKAYKECGFADHAGNANRLAQKPAIVARVAWLKARAAEKTVTTVADIARQLDEDRHFARQNGHSAAAVSATVAKAKVLGLEINRHLMGIRRVEDLTKSECLEMLMGMDNETFDSMISKVEGSDAIH